ncbi:MAG: TorF family putative porin [Panacagrimonas sp.]
MNSFKRWTAGAAACGAFFCAPVALGATTGHVGVFSDYVFRGQVAEGGAAVQGGIDYAGANGILAGVWNSNANPFGGNEFDVYAGYLHKINDKLLVDVGALYYIFSEDEEFPLIDVDGDGTVDRTDLDTLEIFVTAFAGPVKFQVYYSPDYLGTDDAAFYYSGTYTHPLKDTVTLAAQVGYTDGDGAEYIYGDSYVDYSLTLNKTVREGLVFSLAFIDTDLDDEGRFAGTEDKPKFLVSAKQTFAF